MSPQIRFKNDGCCEVFLQSDQIIQLENNICPTSESCSEFPVEVPYFSDNSYFTRAYYCVSCPRNSGKHYFELLAFSSLLECFWYKTQI